MDSSPTKLFLPESLSYPVRIVSLDADVGNVTRGDRLLTYSFAYLPANPSPDALPETRFGTWDCPVDGELTAWNVKPGEVISRPKARDRPAVLVTEECTHGEQIAGMCALCGKDMTKCVSYPRQSCDDADGAAPSAWITWEYQTPHERRSK